MRYTLLACATLRQRYFAASRDDGSPGLHRPPHRPQSHPSHRTQSQSRWSSNHSRSWTNARSSPPAPPPSLPSAWSLLAREASHSSSSLAPVSRSPSASSQADDSRWPLLCPSRTDGARASWRQAPCLWAHDGKMVSTPHSVKHLVCGRSTEQ